LSIASIPPSMPITPFPGDSTSSTPRFPVLGDDRIVFRGVSWEAYNSLSEAVTEGRHVRLAYDGTDLEFMTTGLVHENLKELVSSFVGAVASWSRIKHTSFGETTWKSQDAKRGLQADLSYCLDPDKIRAATEALGRNSMDPADYPRPDLAVEIDISDPQVDRPSIYAVLRVSEVWRIGSERKVTIEHLQPDGSYAQVEASRFLHVTAEEIHDWLTAEDVGDEEVWFRRLTEWAMNRGPQA
jgi:Uma2 family endonuclease